MLRCRAPGATPAAGFVAVAVTTDPRVGGGAGGGGGGSDGDAPSAASPGISGHSGFGMGAPMVMVRSDPLVAALAAAGGPADGGWLLKLHGRAVQVDPMQPMLKAPGYMRLNL